MSLPLHPLSHLDIVTNCKNTGSSQPICPGSPEYRHMNVGEPVAPKIATPGQAESRTGDDKNQSLLLGVKVETPYKPYPTQRVMMAKIIRSLKNKQNCVIESPTGTGKTMALLCSVMAWRVKSQSIGKPFVAGTNSTGHSPDAVSSCRGTPLKRQKGDDGDRVVCERDCSSPRCEPPVSGLVEDAAMPRVFFVTRTHGQIEQTINELNTTRYKSNLRTCTLASRKQSCINATVRDNPRGGADVCQQMAENYRIRVLAFRSNAPLGKASGDVCPYYKDMGQVKRKFASLQEKSADRVWDIEDANIYGRMNNVCPYYGARMIHSSAEVIFCPYNYIFDPHIRRNLDIDLHNAVIVIDEAHNIEGSCRESASFQLTEDDIIRFLRATCNFDNNSQVDGCLTIGEPDSYATSVRFFRRAFEMLLENARTCPTARTSPSLEFPQERILSISEMLRFMESANSGPSSVPEIERHVKVLRKGVPGLDRAENSSTCLEETPLVTATECSGETESSQGPRVRVSNTEAAIQNGPVSHECSRLVEHFFHCISLMFAPGAGSETNNYRVVISREIETKASKTKDTRANTRPGQMVDDKNTLARYGVVCGKKVLRINFMCMNPGVLFGEVARGAWSIIAASGTLAPVRMFCEEMGCNFENTFEGGHVIDSDRFYLGVYAVGPTGINLSGAYTNSIKDAYKKEVGRVVVDVCAQTKNGILCFMPSYDKLAQFYKAWDECSILDAITRTGKRIYLEQRSMSPRELDNMLTAYRAQATGSGAIIMAVHRGKVSEGANFSNALARAVISIGIPFSSMNDTNVKLKREFNDRMSKIRLSGLSSGQDWYIGQAMRPLFQAIGRCIRHREDWGAIIIIDSRFSNDGFLDKIPRWLRHKFSINSGPLAAFSYSKSKQQLVEFMTKMAAICSQ